MKKIFLFFVVFCFCLPAFAEYKPIADYDKKNYKYEIEQFIKKQTPLLKKEIKNLCKEIEKEQNTYVRQAIIDNGVDNILLLFYISLVEITNKYVNIKQDIPNTGWYGSIKNIIDPYLKDNNINMLKIEYILKYANNKQVQIKRRYGR